MSSFASNKREDSSLPDAKLTGDMDPFLDDTDDDPENADSKPSGNAEPNNNAETSRRGSRCISHALEHVCRRFGRRRSLPLPPAPPSMGCETAESGSPTSESQANTSTSDTATPMSDESTPTSNRGRIRGRDLRTRIRSGNHTAAARDDTPISTHRRSLPTLSSLEPLSPLSPLSQDQQLQQYLAGNSLHSAAVSPPAPTDVILGIDTTQRAIRERLPFRIANSFARPAQSNRLALTSPRTAQHAPSSPSAPPTPPAPATPTPDSRTR